MLRLVLSVGDQWLVRQFTNFWAIPIQSLMRQLVPLFKPLYIICMLESCIILIVASQVGRADVAIRGGALVG